RININAQVVTTGSLKRFSFCAKKVDRVHDLCLPSPSTNSSAAELNRNGVIRVTPMPLLFCPLKLWQLLVHPSGKSQSGTYSIHISSDLVHATGCAARALDAGRK
ncbi:unnamed protein product, partial [Ectocarpus sp. 12 AP-2014]